MPEVGRKWKAGKSLANRVKARETPSLRHWRRASAYFDRNKAKWLKDAKYRGKYVAIRHGRVADVDADERALSDRLLTRFQDGIYFVSRVVKEEPVYEVSSVILR